MIVANMRGHRISTMVISAGRSKGLHVTINRVIVASVYRRHKVYWVSRIMHGRCPAWALPYLDRVQWGTHANIDNLRCTVATVLQRAAMVAYGLACVKCGEPATGFRTDRDGLRKLQGEFDGLDRREPYPECFKCGGMT